MEKASTDGEPKSSHNQVNIQKNDLPREGEIVYVGKAISEHLIANKQMSETTQFSAH